MSYGFASHIGIGKETAWDTPVAVTDYVESLSESMATVYDRFETRNITGVYFEPKDSRGRQRNEGDWVFSAHPVNVGHALNGVFGQNSITEVLSGTLFTNVFQPRQSDISSQHPLPSYTMEIFRAGTLVNTAFQYGGVQFGTLELAMTAADQLRCTVGMIGKTQRFIAKTTPTFPTSPSEVFVFDTTSISIDGVANTQIEAFTLTVDNQLEGIGTFNNTTTIGKIRRTGPPTVRFNGTFDFQDLNAFNTFVARTEQKFIITVTKANSFKLEIDIPSFEYTAIPISLPGRERITVDFEGRCNYNQGSGTGIRVSLTTTNTF